MVKITEYLFKVLTYFKIGYPHLHVIHQYCLCFVFFSDMTGATIPVPQSEGSCGVRLGTEKNQTLSFISRYDSCCAHVEVN